MRCPLLFLAFVSLVGPGTAQEVQEVSQFRDCGSYSCGLVIGLHGGDVPEFEAIQRGVHTTDEGLCTLADINAYLNTRGIHSEAFDPRQEPEAITSAVIPIRNAIGEGVRYHFCVARPLDDGQYLLYTPPYETDTVSWAHIANYCGDAALLTKQDAPGWFTERLPLLVLLLSVACLAGVVVRRLRPVQAPVGTSLAAAAVMFCLSGCTDADAHAQTGSGVTWQQEGSAGPRVVTPGNNRIKAALCNGTDEPLHVTAVKLSCGCLGASLKGGEVLAPGEARPVELTVSVEPGQRKTLYLTIRFADHEPLPVTLRVEGRGSSSFRFPNQLSLGEARIGQQKQYVYHAEVDEELAHAMLCRDPSKDIRMVSADAKATVQAGTCEYELRDGVYHVEIPLTLLPRDPGHGVAEVSVRVGDYTRTVAIDWIGALPCVVEPAEFVLDASNHDATAVIVDGAKRVRSVTASTAEIELRRNVVGDDLSVTAHCSSAWATGAASAHVTVETVDGTRFNLPVVLGL